MFSTSTMAETAAEKATETTANCQTSSWKNGGKKK